MISLYDSHTHLNHELLFPDWKQHVLDFIKEGGKGLINIWANSDYNTRALSIAEESKKIFPDCRIQCSVGYHPCDVKQIWKPVPEAMQELKQQILNHKESIVAIWECGIDLHYDKKGETLELQEFFLIEQCKLSKELWLPIIIHSRDAFDETLQILKEYPDIKIYFHCWGYDEKEVQILLSLFPHLFIGFCWNITYPKAENLRASVRILPKEKLLIETDAPYLSPQNFRGQTNTPQNIQEIWSYISDLLAIGERELWGQVERNFWNLYSK